MGGRVALEIMRTAGSRVRALALLNTGYQQRPGGTAGEAEVRARQSLVELACTRGMRAMGEVWVRDMVPPQRLADRPLIEAILAMVERRTPQVLAAQIRALLARPEAGDVLPQISCPTLLLCGREDAWSPLARHAAMQRLIRDSQLEVIEDCGHMAPMERPAAVAACLAGWLHALPPSP
jgi:pimeloyl-ACP methyl ester carboxylesterase